MASIYQRGRVWWICYYENGKKSDVSLKTKDRTVAKFKKNEIENKLLADESPLPHKNKNLNEIKEEFLERQKARVSNAHYIGLKSYLEQFSQSQHPIKLTDFNDANVEAFLAEKSKYSEYLKRNIISCLKAFLNWCVSRNYIYRNPLKVKKPKVKKSPHRFLSLEEIRRLIQSSKNEIVFAPIMLALYTGARKSEIKRLQWSDIDFINNRILIRAGKTENFRYVPLVQKLKRFLNQYRQNSAEGRCFTEWANQRRIIKRIKRKARLKDVTRFWYTLRHTFASHYYMNTHDLKGLSQTLGHSDISITAGVYVHLLDGHAKSNINRLGY